VYMKCARPLLLHVRTLRVDWSAALAVEEVAAVVLVRNCRIEALVSALR
jgi:hypothetical protein